MLNPVLKWSALSLGALFVGQASYLAVTLQTQPRPTYFASWQFNPASLEEASKMADQEVVGQVVRVRRAADLTTQAPGEPGGVDRIPVEVITLRLEKAYKGGQAETVEVFHTGSTSSRGQRQAPTPPAGTLRPAGMRGEPSDDETRTTWLEGDPPYQQGERYLLLLAGGPTLDVDGQKVATKRPVSPEGRYRVGGGGELEPMSNRAEFATRLRGRRLQEVESSLGRPHEPPQPQTGRPIQVRPGVLRPGVRPAPRPTTPQ
jgi:hypothetical protein